MKPLALFLALLLAACASPHPLVPTGARTGQWGGTDAALSANAASVRLTLACGPIEFMAPIVPDVNGQFVVDALGRQPNDNGINAPSTPPAILTGTVTGTTMLLRVQYLRPDNSGARTFTVVENQAAVYRTPCAP